MLMGFCMEEYTPCCEAEELTQESSVPGNKEDVTKLWGKVIKLDEKDGQTHTQ